MRCGFVVFLFLVSAQHAHSSMESVMTWLSGESKRKKNHPLRTSFLEDDVNRVRIDSIDDSVFISENDPRNVKNLDDSSSEGEASHAVIDENPQSYRYVYVLTGLTFLFVFLAAAGVGGYLMFHH